MDIGLVTATIKLDDKFTPVLSNVDEKLKRTTVGLGDAAKKAQTETDKIAAGFKRVAAQLDPTIAAHQKYEGALLSLGKALDKGLVTQHAHNELIEKAKEKYLGGAEGGSAYGSMLKKVIELSGLMGGATKEVSEGIEGVSGKFANLGGIVSELGPLAVPIIALAAAVAGLAIGFKAFEFLADAVKEGMAFQATITQLNNLLEKNGTTTHMSAREMQEYADSLVVVSGRDEDVILKGVQVLAHFDKLGEEGFKKATRLALDYAQATGKDVGESSTLVGKALEGNTKSFGALAEIGIVLQKSQKATLTQMVETGNVAGYQAIVFKLLQDKVGGAAEAYSKTLAGSIAIAGTVMGEFKKGIASELIPALEDLVNDLVGSVGGWKVIREAAMAAGHDVGDAVRTMVFGAQLGFHEFLAEVNTFDANLSLIILKVVGGTLGMVGAVAAGMGKLPGALGATYRDAADQIKIIQAGVSIGLSTRAAEDRKFVEQEAMTVAGLTIEFNKHRQALEADDKVHPKLGASTDAVAKKFKDLEAAVATVKKIMQDYSDQIDDIVDKQRHQAGEQDNLSEALDNGLLAYKQAEVEQQRSAAITTALTAVYKDHRAEIEKLIQERNKLTVAGHTAEAANIQASIDAETKAYGDQAAAIGISTGKIFDQTQANKLRAQGEQEILTLQNQLALDQAKLTDLTNRDSTATRAVTADQAHEKDVLALLSSSMQTRLSDLRFLIGLNHDATIAQTALNSALDNTANVRASVSDWQQQREAALTYGTEIAAILKQYGLLDDATQRRAIDEKVEAAVRSGMGADKADDLRRELEGQQQIVNGLHAMQAQIEINGRVYKDFADQLAQNFSGVIGSFLKGEKVGLDDFRNAVQDTFASILEKQIQTWLTTWFEAMAQWLSRWVATQAVARAVQAGGGSGGNGGDGTSYGDMAASMAASGAVKYAGSSGVGGASGLLSGSGSAGALGAVGAWVVILGVFGMLVNSLSDHLQKTEESVIDFHKALDVQMVSGGKHIDSLVASGQALAEQVKSFFTSFGGIFQSLDSSVAIKRRGQGSNTEWKVYADGLVVSFGKDFNAAMGYAMIEVIKHSSSIGLDPLVAAAIKDYAGKSLDEFQAQVAFAERLATQNLPGIAGQVNAAATQYFSDLRQAQTQFANDLPALNTAIDSIVRKFEETVQGIKNSALGINTATADFLAGLVGFQSQMSHTSGTVASTIQQLIDGTQAKIEEMLRKGPGHAVGGGPTGGVNGNTPDGGNAGTGGDRGRNGGGPNAKSSVDLEWNAQLAELQKKIEEYKAQLAKIPKALSDTEVNMAVFNSLYTYLQGSGKYAKQAAEYAKIKVELEFASIKLQLIALGKWEEFAGMWGDALSAAEKAAITQARAAKGGSNSGPSGPTLADLRASIATMRAEAAGAAQKAFYDLTLSIADFTKNAKSAKLPAAELATAIDLMTKKFRDDLRVQAEGLAGVGTDFTSRLKNVTDFFSQLEDLGRNKTGIPNWLERLLKGDALGRLGTELGASIDQFNGLVDPMVSVNAQADTLRQNTIAYGKAAGWTAEQIQAALDKINAGVDYQKEIGVNGIMDTLFGYLKDDAKYAQQSADLKKKEIDLQFTLIEAQLKAFGAWDTATQDIFNAAKRAAENISAPTSQQLSPADYAAAVASDKAMVAGGGTSSGANLLQDALDLLHKYENDGLDPLTQKLIGINADFTKIRAQLGNTPQVIADYNRAIKAAYDDFTASIRQTKHDLFYGSTSSVDTQGKFLQAQLDFQAALAKFNSGDLSGIPDVSGIVTNLVQLAQQVDPVGSQAYAAIEAQANAFLNRILGLDPNAIATATAAAQLGATINNPVNVAGISDLVAASHTQNDTLDSIRAASALTAATLIRMNGTAGSGLNAAP